MNSHAGEETPLTSVIIPTWNGCQILIDCLNALSRQCEPPGGFEVIVVDNGSTDGTELVLRRRFPWVRCLTYERNLGFAKACNIGIRAARGEYLVLLNNDTIPDGTWLTALVGRAKRSDAGAIASKLLFAGDNRIINNAGSVLLPDSDWPVKDRGINELDEGQYDSAPQPSAFCGAAVLLKRTMLESIGLFDEHFFMYWEDADLSWRAKLRGWSTDFEPTAVVKHLHAATSGEMSPFFRYNVSRNRVLVLAKHGSAWNTVKALLEVVGVFALGGVRHVATGNFHAAVRDACSFARLMISLLACAPWVVLRRAGMLREATLPARDAKAVAPAKNPNISSWPRRLRVGVYNPYMGSMGGGERLTVAIAEALMTDYDVEILGRKMHGIPSLAELEERFDVRLPGVSLVDLDAVANGKGWWIRKWLPPSLRRRGADLRDYGLVRRRGYDLFINNQFWSLTRCPSPFGIYVCMFPRLKTRSPMRKSTSIRGVSLRLAERPERLLRGRFDEILSSYSDVISISWFTNEWLWRWWEISGNVLYPPCNNWHVEGVEKRKIVLSVGRFFARIEESNHKRHDALIDAFGEVSLAHPDWELHLAGSKAPGEASERYVEELRESALGLRVYFHCDASKAELGLLYNEASIYWHAAGFGEGNGDHPERQEHFGITTVEAMSAGAVPIVFPGGGQREIVTDGVDGYYWESLRALVERTSALMEDESALRVMSRRGQCAARRFAPERFRQDFVREVERVLREGVAADDARRRRV